MFVPAVTSQLTIVEGKYKDPISCFSDCYPSCTASWKKGAQNTPLATDEVLSLGYVNRSDTGNFTCMSTNAATEYHKSLVRDIALVVQCKFISREGNASHLHA